jgi:site-specific recombinase
LEKILEEFITNKNHEKAVELIRVLVSNIRPTLFEKNTTATEKIKQLNKLLKENESYCTALKENILQVIHQSQLTNLFTEIGIITKENFWSEASRKLSHKLLPPVEEESSIQQKIHQIFIDNNDFEWVNTIDNSIWNDFFITLNFSVSNIPNNVIIQIFNSLKILSYRIVALGLEKEIIGKIDAQNELLSPFLIQNKEVYDLVMSLNPGLSATDVTNRFEKITLLLIHCKSNLVLIKEQTSVNGASLHQSFIIKRIEQMIVRMQIMIDLMNDKSLNTPLFVQFFKTIIYEEQNKNRLREFFADNISLLSYQIAEHKSKSGEHYIANNRAEYKKFFYAACGGGVIISFIVIFKILIHHAHYAPFWEAIMYSLNYAMGFILIHITGSSLATKQPAMTASALARALDAKANGDSTTENFAKLIAKVWSSQTIAFIGNLLVVFPLTLGWIILYNYITGHNLIDNAEAQKMLDANNPLKSLVWLYAAITGFFLFLSSIISGYYDNKVIYDFIPKRIRKHPYLKKMLPESLLFKLADYLEHNLGSIIGNFLLGFFLGTATFIGEILGWYYDIRHITISSGYFSIGVYQNFLQLQWLEILTVFIGVLGVGFINFLVSFSLAFFVALRARNIKITDYKGLYNSIITYLKTNTSHFFIPPKSI